MSSEVQKRGKLVREVRGPRDKTNGRDRDALSWHFLSGPLPGVPFWPSPILEVNPSSLGNLTPSETDDSQRVPLCVAPAADPSLVRGLLGTGPPNPPRPPLLRGWFGIDLTSIRHRFPHLTLCRCQIDPWRREGEADSRVGFGGPVPNKLLTILVHQQRELGNGNKWGKRIIPFLGGGRNSL